MLFRGFRIIFIPSGEEECEFIIKIGGRHDSCIVIFTNIKTSISAFNVSVFNNIGKFWQEIFGLYPLRHSFLDDMLQPHEIIAPWQRNSSNIRPCKSVRYIAMLLFRKYPDSIITVMRSVFSQRFSQSICITPFTDIISFVIDFITIISYMKSMSIRFDVFHLLFISFVIFYYQRKKVIK